MARVDLHAHSKYSNHPSEWFLQRLGASESYTEPEAVYKMARSRGMDFVTVTDHNCMRASLELVQKYPQHCFTGVEVTTYFPEDNCKIHVLVYGLNQDQFAVIQALRKNIYQLRDYLRDQDLACVVAHATYSINNRLTLDHLEKLILLFNNFEGRNGSRSTLHNDVLARVLKGLDADDIERLQAKHKLETWGETPWQKGLTGGSDDHAGFFIGKTCTETNAATPQEFIAQLKNGRMQPCGRQNDFQGLTFAIYKIAYDFSQQHNTPFSHSTVSELTQHLFCEKRLGFKDRLKLNKLKRQKENPIYQSIIQLLETSKALDQDDIDSRLDLLYECISDISDQYFCSLLKSLNADIEEMDIIRMIQGLSSTIPGIFLSVPFFSSFRHMFGDRDLINSLDTSLGKHTEERPKRILWLTDTLTDLNGVSMTLQTIGRLADEKGYDIKILASLDPDQEHGNLPKSTLMVPPIHEFQLPHYEQLQIKMPSVLRMLKMVYAYNPDEVYISTPGPVGLLGLMMGKMLGTKVSGIYHTDFTMESAEILDEPAISNMIESYNKWFFNQFDTLLVPTEEYMQLLKERGYRYRHMQRFQRGLRTEHFKPEKTANRFHSGQQPRLLYCGRISKDKNLDFLLATYRQLLRSHPTAALTVVGDGPYLAEMKEQCRYLNNVEFLGRVDYQQLPQIYNSHDLFLFPSITDTFGMAVLEAQACGLPALVSDVGGPKEIVVNGQTGHVLPVKDPADWAKALDCRLRDLKEGGESYALMSKEARNRVENNYSWDRILHNMVKADAIDAPRRHSVRQRSPFNRLLKLASSMMVG
ncbi:Glycosyltransferase involved in cell wall bisynthesis [Malonomonas rubra DSM 5091]|uniref:Glycosyltransferase involved in cell wall bisynthesis n=1 Tax=Malonomonas rubra DSM 5091 TaxID=1122189 RepID=A0A1M6H4Z1_MALRU|nr:glycosyltransferase [Malonomonas rubra]SHJ17273.1 Glycosyltransferase involved in cell wall bisynthesis [Malonomonas rubra DSM 5091]